MDVSGFHRLGIATEISSDDFDTALSGEPSTVGQRRSTISGSVTAALARLRSAGFYLARLMRATTASPWPHCHDFLRLLHAGLPNRIKPKIWDPLRSDRHLDAAVARVEVAID